MSDRFQAIISGTLLSLFQSGNQGLFKSLGKVIGLGNMYEMYETSFNLISLLITLSSFISLTLTVAYEKVKGDNKYSNSRIAVDTLITIILVIMIIMNGITNPFPENKQKMFILAFYFICIFGLSLYKAGHNFWPSFGTLIGISTIQLLMFKFDVINNPLILFFPILWNTYFDLKSRNNIYDDGDVIEQELNKEKTRRDQFDKETERLNALPSTGEEGKDTLMDRRQKSETDTRKKMDDSFAQLKMDISEFEKNRRDQFDIETERLKGLPPTGEEGKDTIMDRRQKSEDERRKNFDSVPNVLIFSNDLENKRSSWFALLSILFLIFIISWSYFYLKYI